MLKKYLHKFFAIILFFGVLNALCMEQQPRYRSRLARRTPSRLTTGRE